MSKAFKVGDLGVIRGDIWIPMKGLALKKEDLIGTLIELRDDGAIIQVDIKHHIFVKHPKK